MLLCGLNLLVPHPSSYVLRATQVLCVSGNRASENLKVQFRNGSQFRYFVEHPLLMVLFENESAVSVREYEVLIRRPLTLRMLK